MNQILAVVLPTLLVSVALSPPAEGEGAFILTGANGVLVVASSIDLTHAWPPGRDIILRGEALVIPEGVSVRAGKGSDGADIVNNGVAIGGNGGKGGDIIIEAQRVIVDGWLYSGDGGDGGRAVSAGSPADARGGRGGDPGMIVGYDGTHQARGRFGDGGDAEARGVDGSCSHPDAKAVSARGVSGVTPGADGDSANATGGMGADACSPGAAGGRGGSAYAFGGDASGTGEHAGRPGDAIAVAGRGGNGGDDCGTERSVGGEGGLGGEAVAYGGNVTLGAYLASGQNFTAGNASATAGSGGHGGDGPPGQAGRGGGAGDAHAFGGSVNAAAIATPAGAGGSAVFLRGDGGNGGDVCEVTREATRDTPNFGLLGLGAAFIAAFVLRRFATP